jgi:hypothetical protein
MRFRLPLVAPIVAVGMLTAPAAGFYFPGWPGSGEPKPPTLIPPDTPKEGNPPSAVPPLEDEPGRPPPGGEHPSYIPEPGTLTAAVLGLSALAARAVVRRRKK